MRYRITALAIILFALILVGLTGAAQTQNYNAISENRSLAGAFAPSRVTETRAEANARIVETRVVESQSVNGGWALVTATERETVSENGHAAHVLERFFVPDASGRRRLSQTVETDMVTQAGGEVQTIRTVSVVDVNGRSQTARREVQNVVPINASISRTKTTTYSNRGNGFEPVEETEQLVERKDSGALQVQRTRRIKDANGKFITAEMTESTSQREADGALTSEETVLRGEPGRDPRESGLLPVQKVLTKSWKDDTGAQRSVVQTYSTQIPGVVSSRELKLQERISASRGVMPDGATQAIAQVEQQAASAPNEGLRLKAQVIEVVRPNATGQFESERTVKSVGSSGATELVAVTDIRGSGAGISERTR